MDDVDIINLYCNIAILPPEIIVKIIRYLHNDYLYMLLNLVDKNAVHHVLYDNLTKLGIRKICLNGDLNGFKYMYQNSNIVYTKELFTSCIKGNNAKLFKYFLEKYDNTQYLILNLDCIKLAKNNESWDILDYMIINIDSLPCINSKRSLNVNHIWIMQYAPIDTIKLIFNTTRQVTNFDIKIAKKCGRDDLKVWLQKEYRKKKILDREDRY